MSAMLLYEKITLLNRDRHRRLRLRPHKGLGFAGRTHIVPLALVEFVQAARDCPILFVGESDKRVPVALLGLKEQQNSFVDADGNWLKNTYVPAFIRRYPFVLADTGEDRFSVCFDEAFEGWNETEGTALFDEDGKNTPFLDEVIQFLKGFTAEMKRTQVFTRKLEELGLLAEKRLELVHTSGERFTVNDFLAVDEEAFNKLDDEQFLTLRREGFLAPVYAHLMSLGTANRLFDRYVQMRAESADEKAADAAESAEGTVEEEPAGAEVSEK